MPKNVAIEMLKSASALGYTLEVYSDGFRDYKGQSHIAAWEACKAVEECHVQIRGPHGKMIGSLYVIPELDPEENVASYSDQPGETWVDTEWNRIFNENERRAA